MFSFDELKTEENTSLKSSSTTLVGHELSSLEDDSDLEKRNNLPNSKEFSTEIIQTQENNEKVRENLYQARMLRLDLDKLALKVGRHKEYNAQEAILRAEYMERLAKAKKDRENKLQCVMHKYLAEIVATECDFKEEKQNAYDEIYESLMRERRNVLQNMAYQRRKLEKAKPLQDNEQTQVQKRKKRRRRNKKSKLVTRKKTQKIV